MVWKKWCCRNNDAQPSQTRPFKSWGFQKNTQLTKKYQAASCSRCAASADFLLTGKPMASANSEARIHLPCLGDHKMFPAWRRVGIFSFTPLHILRKAGFWDRSKRHPASWDGSLPISFLHIDMYAARYSRCIGVRRYAQSTEHRFQLVFHSSPVLSIQKFWWWSCKNRCHSQGSDLRRQWITYVLVNGSKISQHGWPAPPDENGEESWATNETPSKVCRAGRHMDDDIGMAKCSV